MRRVSEEVLEDELDKHFATHHSWVPDRLERPMYKTMYALVLCITDEVLREMRVDCLGDEVLFHLVPGPMPWPAGSPRAGGGGGSGGSGGGGGGGAGGAAGGGAVALGAGAAGGRGYGQHELIVAALFGAIVGGVLFR